VVDVRIFIFPALQVLLLSLDFIPLEENYFSFNDDIPLGALPYGLLLYVSILTV